jgi:hypothetical protein
MTRPSTIAVLMAVLLIAGCGDGGATAKRAGSSGPAKGAQVRVFNMGSESFETFLNGLTYGRPLEPQAATSFKLTSSKKPALLLIKASGGDEEFEIPVEAGTAYTLVYLGKGKTTVIEGEPTVVASEKSMVYFENMSPGESGAVNIKSGVVTNVDLKNKESKEVATGSYVATYKLANGKEASVNFDLSGGHVVSVYLVNDGSQDRLVVVLNHSQMIILAPSGASPAG